MEKYKNEDYLRNIIVEQSRHLFIYGYDNDYRSEFLKSMEKYYPVAVDSDKPVALYFDSLVIPKIDVNLKDKDSYLIHAISSEYLSFTIATKIIERTMELDKNILDSRLSKLLSLISRNMNNGYAEIGTIEDLLKEIKISRDFYYENYINYVKGSIEKISIDDVSIPFLELEMFVSQYKRAMNIDSYFVIIFNKKDDLSVPLTQAINNLIGGRINKDISVKVAIEPDNWETYLTANDQLIEETHDFGVIELDSSYKKFMKSLKKTNY